MQKKSHIYVIGHKNPDTDSICSSIVYAEIKNKTKDPADKWKYVPRRAGSMNNETKFVLDYFKVPAPAYLPNAGTQVKEIEIHETPGASEKISAKKAWERMKNENIVTLPITTEDNRLAGLISVNDIVRSYMDVYDNQILSKAKTQYKAIAETLDGQVICGDPEGWFSSGKVLIGAFLHYEMGSILEQGDMVILGNRLDDQVFALDKKVSCMIVGLNSRISDIILRLAHDNGTVIITTPYDTLTIARLINQSIPISHMMKKTDLITFTTDSYINDVREVLKTSRHRDFPVMDQDGKYVGTISRRNLIGGRKKKLILVDHNEESQALDNVNDAEIIEIIDHHRLGSLETMAPIMFRNQPVGCTSTILYQICLEQALEITREMAGLMVSAIISDTLMFRSPTCTPMDRAAANALATIAGIDIESYATKMFRAGSNLSGKSAEELFYQDFKTFVIGEFSFGVGQITSLDAEELKTVKERLLPHMRKEAGTHEISDIFFMLTNILEESTELVFSGEEAREMILKSFNVEIGENSCILPGVVSRKKQMIPAFMNALQTQEGAE